METNEGFRNAFLALADDEHIEKEQERCNAITHRRQWWREYGEMVTADRFRSDRRKVQDEMLKEMGMTRHDILWASCDIERVYQWYVQSKGRMRIY